LKKIVLISCVKSKLSHPAKAKDLYTSTLFKSNMQYARQLEPDGIYILSAKYGLLELEREIAPYEMTLNTMSERAKRAWAQQVLEALRLKADLRADLFIFLAGQNYRKYLVPYLAHVEVPLEGLAFGQQLRELKRRNTA
jgi:hypothetical protein